MPAWPAGRSPILIVFVALTVTASNGCARKHGLWPRAARDLNCPVEELEITDMGAGLLRVEGCGRYAEYICTRQPDTMSILCVDKTESTDLDGFDDYSDEEEDTPSSSSVPPMLAPLSEKEVKVKFQSQQFQQAVKNCIEGSAPPAEFKISVVVAPNGESVLQALEPQPPDHDVKKCMRETMVHLKFRPIGKKTGLKWFFKTGSTSPSDWKSGKIEASPPVGDYPEGGEVAEPDDGCDPACRKGYVCKEGACVSLCNPPCPAGSYCTTDGTDCIPSM